MIADELAESFVNGNRAWVADRIVARARRSSIDGILLALDVNDQLDPEQRRTLRTLLQNRKDGTSWG